MAVNKASTESWPMNWCISAWTGNIFKNSNQCCIFFAESSIILSYIGPWQPSSPSLKQAFLQWLLSFAYKPPFFWLTAYVCVCAHSWSCAPRMTIGIFPLSYIIQNQEQKKICKYICYPEAWALASICFGSCKYQNRMWLGLTKFYFPNWWAQNSSPNCCSIAVLLMKREGNLNRIFGSSYGHFLLQRTCTDKSWPVNFARCVSWQLLCPADLPTDGQQMWFVCVGTSTEPSWLLSLCVTFGLISLRVIVCVHYVLYACGWLSMSSMCRCRNVFFFHNRKM